MSVLLQRIFLMASLAMVPSFSLAASDAEEKAEETAGDATVTKEAGDKADGDAAQSDEQDDAEVADEKLNTEPKALDAQDDEWAEKLRKRHHEGDVALGVCGARMTALMWFYQASVADGRDDLQPAYDAIKESRTILKDEAERRAVEDGVGTSVSVMNEYSVELWEELITASEEPESFQEAHDTLFANVQECLTLFFRRGKTVQKAAPAEGADDAEDDAKKDDGAEEKASD